MPKPKYQINITEAAEKDLGDIIDYISADNPTAALKMATRIEKNILKLKNFPLIGCCPSNQTSRTERISSAHYRRLSHFLCNRR
jgi:plasmid stabilization system protein ParE